MRNISKKDFFDILKANSTFKESLLLGFQALEVSSYEAFLYSAITGAQYLDDLVFPFTPKGLMKVFHSHTNDRFVTGLWSELLPHFSPLKIVAVRPFLAQGTKYLVPVEFENEVEYARKVAELYTKQSHPGQILVHRIETSKDGGGQESLLEYLSCEYFRMRGYLVDSQIPLPQKFGSPDWMAVSPFLLSTEFEIFQGRYIFELGMNSVNWDKRPNRSITTSSQVEEFIVGEAKVASADPIKQISKYMETGIFNRSVLSVTDPSEKYLEMSDQLSFDQSWKLKFANSVSEYPNFKSQKGAEFAEFLITVAKFYLLSNFSDQKISRIVSFDVLDRRNTQLQLLKLVRAIPLANLLES
jgi:hypothetical protein